MKKIDVDVSARYSFCVTDEQYQMLKEALDSCIVHADLYKEAWDMIAGNITEKYPEDFEIERVTDEEGYLLWEL